MKNKLRLYFDRLIGDNYTLEEKLIILDWMLKTGKHYDKRFGRWTVNGVDKCLFGYSANSHNSRTSIPAKTNDYKNFFDSVFARAVYLKADNAVIEWRNSENVKINSYRVLKYNKNSPIKLTEKHRHLGWLISNIFNLKGSLLNKHYHHRGYLDRKKPKIIGIKIYSIGNGWQVDYYFSFACYEYEMGWQKQYRQKENESLWSFFGYVYNDLTEKKIIGFKDE